MSRQSFLDKPADIHAELGSETWARGVAAKLRMTAKNLDSDVTVVQDWVRIAAENNVWKILGYVSLDAFLVAEADITQEFIDAIRNAKGGTVRDATAAVEAARENPMPKHGGDRKSAVEEAKESPQPAAQDKDLTLISSNSNEGILRRLARDGHEELLDAIANEEMSVNAAAIQAGYRKRKSPEELCVANFRKCESRLVALRVIFDELEPHEAAVVRQWLEATQ